MNKHESHYRLFSVSQSELDEILPLSLSASDESSLPIPSRAVCVLIIDRRHRFYRAIPSTRGIKHILTCPTWRARFQLLNNDSAPIGDTAEAVTLRSGTSPVVDDNSPALFAPILRVATRVILRQWTNRGPVDGKIMQLWISMSGHESAKVPGVCLKC